MGATMIPDEELQEFTCYGKNPILTSKQTKEIGCDECKYKVDCIEQFHGSRQHTIRMEETS